MKLDWVPFSGQIGQFSKKFIPPNLVVPIFQGPLRGTKWFVTSGILECPLGIYEQEKVALFAKSIRRNWIVYDLGANVGYYTLLSSKLVGNKGKVVSFEPNPCALKYLKKHIEVNHVSNVKIIEAAVTNKIGKQFFDNSSSLFLGHLAVNGKLEVATLTVDSCAKKIGAPNCMKIDVEGSEYDVLKGAKESLATSKPLLFIATHGFEKYLKCIKFLENLKYKIRTLSWNRTYDRQEIVCWV